jgi:hypothetical protein
MTDLDESVLSEKEGRGEIEKGHLQIPQRISFLPAHWRI